VLRTPQPVLARFQLSGVIESISHWSWCGPRRAAAWRLLSGRMMASSRSRSSSTTSRARASAS
jgi:hypothetical protein